MRLHCCFEQKRHTWAAITQLSCCVMKKRQGWTEKIGFSIFIRALSYLFMLLSCNTPTDIRTLRIPVVIAHVAILTHACSPSFVIECRSVSLYNVLIRSRATNVQHTWLIAIQSTKLSTKHVTTSLFLRRRSSRLPQRRSVASVSAW